MKYAKAVSRRIFFLITALLLLSSPAFAKALVIQDTYPWGLSAIQTILTNNTISYDQISSSQIGVTDLSIYDMVIVPSVQGDTYYSNWNSYLYEIEEYVYNGGKLWQSTCNYSGDTVPQILGGVLSISDYAGNNDITAPGHAWVNNVPNPMSGSDASHSSYTTLYPGSTIIATAQTTGRPVLVDYRYGAGRVLITGQTLEFAWNANWDAKPILENSLLELYNSVDDVLIIQDLNPGGKWIYYNNMPGYPSIQEVLTLNYVHYDQLKSADIAATDLTPYKMIIVPSLQGDTFYTNWNANISKIEAYVHSGGKLWQSTCNESSTTPEPLIPGGVVSSTDVDFYNTISSPNHPWVKSIPTPIYGSGASHDSFTNLYPGSKVIARAQSSGRPVLVDYHYGDGRVLITGQPLEFAWMLGWEGGPILENSLLELKSSTDDVLIVQDTNPWGVASTKTILANNIISYDQINSSQISTTALTDYKMVIVPSAQGNTYYTKWNTNIAKIESYVSKGGKLWLSTCNTSEPSPVPLIPGGVIISTDLDYYNKIAAANHPWVKGITSPVYGNHASYNGYTSLYPGSKVVAKAQTSGLPVLVDYKYGEGRVLITGQPLEWAWQYNWDEKPILENSLVEMFNYKPFPWNLFLPAILMNKGKH